MEIETLSPRCSGGRVLFVLLVVIFHVDESSRWIFISLLSPLLATAPGKRSSVQFHDKCPSDPRESGVRSDKTRADRCLGRLRAAGTGLAMIISVLALLLYYIRDVPLRAASPCHSLRAYWR